MDNTICKTCVKNVRIKSIRPQYKNIVEWIDDPNNIYIGRDNIVVINNERQPKQKSIWSNPYKSKDYPSENILELYFDYITMKIENENLIDELFKLKGKNLGCWCINTDDLEEKIICHGQILMHLIDKFFPDKKK